MAAYEMPPGFPDLVRKIIAQNKRLVGRDARGRRARAQHGRSHGCVEAVFRVRGDLPERLRRGLFAQAAERDAVLRFSNGARTRDDAPDAHGLAVKVFGVPGGTLLDRHRPGGEAAEGPAEVDFLFVDTDTYPSFDPGRYEALNRQIAGFIGLRRAAAEGPLSGVAVYEGLRALLRGFLTPEGREITEKARAFAGQVMHSPLAAVHWSTQPFRHGPDLVVRHLLRPETAGPGTAPTAPLTDPDGIGKRLREDVAAGPHRLEFCVIEPPDWLGADDLLDCRLPWACDAPRGGRAAVDPRHRTVTPVADILIARNAAFDPDDGQAFEFSPWRVPPAHEPLGPINLIRLFTYLALAQERFPNK